MLGVAMTLGDKIRSLRAVEGSLRGLNRPMTQQEMAAAMKRETGRTLSQAYLSQLENGSRPHLTHTTRELLARIRALLRRANKETPTASFSDVEVDFERRTTTRAGSTIKLTPAEYNLLTFFLRNVDRALTRDYILNAVWGYESYPNTRTVDAHVVRLRQKLEPEPGLPKHFLTVHGVGYRFLP